MHTCMHTGDQVFAQAQSVHTLMHEVFGRDKLLDPRDFEVCDGLLALMSHVWTTLCHYVY